MTTLLVSLTSAVVGYVVIVAGMAKLIDWSDPTSIQPDPGQTSLPSLPTAE